MPFVIIFLQKEAGNSLARGKVMAEPKHVLYAIPQSVCYENPRIVQNEGF